MKYLDAKVVMQEVPDELTLAINLTNCPNRCVGCHSPELREDIGTILDTKSLHTLIKYYRGVSCVAFMGGDSDQKGVADLCSYIKNNYMDINTAWYSGNDYFPKFEDLTNVDYIKIGSYMKEYGPLNSDTTNQRLYRLYYNCNNRLKMIKDITYRFWKRE